MENLAQELVDAIIKEASSYTFFYHESSPTLCATSLVCRSWLPTSQRLLFHSVDLTLTGRGQGQQRKYQRRRYQQRRYQQLYGALLESPHLAGYIKHLRVTSKVTISISRTLPLFLRKLDNLRNLSLYIPWDMCWGDLDLGLRQAVVWVCQLPSMRDVEIFGHFVNMNALTSFLYYTRFLSSLSLERGFHRSSLEEEETGQQEDVAGQKDDADKLERFDLGKSGHLSQLSLSFHLRFNYLHFITWLLGPRSYFKVENIHTLSIHHIRHHEDGESIHRLLHAIAIPLKRLRLAMYNGK